MKKPLPNIMGRMRWKCRRGMLELDLMLLKFLDEQFLQLTAAEKDDFERLLEMPDPVLQEYLYGISVPEDLGFQHILKKIRPGDSSLK